jgi:hypothetical protein
MPQRRPHRFRTRPGFEQLEDRSVPAVIASQDGAGVVSITLNAANDSATVLGTGAGTALDVTDETASTTQSFTGVTGILIVDGGTNLGQTVRFEDDGTGTSIALSGAISVTNIETVQLATANSTVQAGSVSVAGASAIRLDANVTTNGSTGQSYDGPVVLGAATVTLDAGATGPVNFPQTVNGLASKANALVVNAGGITTFTGIVGNSIPLASITTDAAGTAKLGANIITSGVQIYNDPVTLTGISIALTTNDGGDVRFNNTVNGSTSGANSIVINTSGITLLNAMVGTTPLGGLTTDNAGTTQIKANVTTIGAQTYNDPVVLFGNTIAIGSTVGANITFGDTVNSSVAGETALTVTTSSGVTTFGGSVGATAALASLTTSEGSGNTVFGTNSVATRSVITTGPQTYNDPIRLNAASVAFESTANGNITFNTTLNGTSGVTTNAVVNTGGLTSFIGIVGGSVPLNRLTTDNQGQTNEATAIRASVTITDDIAFNDAVNFTPNTGITSQQVASTIGDITFGSTFGSESAVPVTVKAGANLVVNGNGTFSANGSRLNMQAGATGAGAFTIPAGRTFRADVQTWQAGDAIGGLTSAVIDLVTNAPAFRDAVGTNAPKTFVLRQDGAMTDSAIPAIAQFGSAPPANYSIFSDDSTLTLNSTTALAGFGTANLTLAASQALTLGTTINAPSGIVRLRSVSANINQPAGGISAASLGLRSGTAINMTGTNAITGTVAALATTSSVQFANGSPYTIGSIGADPLNLNFPATSGLAAAAGTVTLSQTGSNPLNITVAAPLSGSAVTATGGTADDKITVNYSLGATLANGLTFNGNGGVDTLAFTDAGSSTAHTYAVGSTFTRDSSAVVTHSGVEIVSVVGGSAADTFNVTPDATAAITVTGGNPTGTTGDKLALTLAGATNPSLSASKLADGFQGTATFGNRAAVSFSQVESISPQTDIQVTATAAPQRIPASGTSTITVVVKNAGPDAATGIDFDQDFPANATFTWTAVASSGSSVAATSGTGDIDTTMDLLLNGTVTFTITVTPNPNVLGTLTTTATAASGTTTFDSDPSNNSATVSVIVEATSLLAVGAGAGAGPHVKVYNADGSQRFSFFAYDASFTGGVTGDGVEDIVTGAATSASHVKVFDGASGAEIASFYAFPGFVGGVNVAVAGGDVVVGAGNGGGPVFAGYDITGGNVTQTFSLFAFDPGFRGGVRVAGSENLIAVAAGPTGSSHVRVFDASTRAERASFYAFPQSMTAGVNIAMGKSGNTDTVIVGAGTGATPAVVTVEATSGNIIGSSLAFASNFTGGVRVAGTTTPSGQAGVVYAAGPGGTPRVRVLTTTGASQLDFFAFDPSFLGGIYVG